MKTAVNPHKLDVALGAATYLKDHVLPPLTEAAYEKLVLVILAALDAHDDVKGRNRQPSPN
jgi:hypothetical protein